MKRSHTSIQTSEDDFQFDNSNNPKQLEFSQKILQNAKKILKKFIDSIPDLKNHPCSLDKFEQDLIGLKFRQVDVNLLMDHMDNTIRKMLNNKKIKSNWNKDDLIILLWIIQKYNTKFQKTTHNYISLDWEIISSMIPGKTGQQCMFKWLTLKYNRNSQKQPWTQAQDQLLKYYASQSTYNYWFDISKKLYHNCEIKVYRTPKQCKQRWCCYLNPLIKKGQWQPLQDYLLICKYLEFGKKWAKIIRLLKGRTENAVKNRFNLLLSKYAKNSIITDATVRVYFQNFIKQLQQNNGFSLQILKPLEEQDLIESNKKKVFQQKVSTINKQFFSNNSIQIKINASESNDQILQKEQQISTQINYNDCLIQMPICENREIFSSLNFQLDLIQSADNFMTQEINLDWVL